MTRKEFTDINHALYQFVLAKKHIKYALETLNEEQLEAAVERINTCYNSGSRLIIKHLLNKMNRDEKFLKEK